MGSAGSAGLDGSAMFHVKHLLLVSSVGSRWQPLVPTLATSGGWDVGNDVTSMNTRRPDHVKREISPRHV